MSGNAAAALWQSAPSALGGTQFLAPMGPALTIAGYTFQDNEHPTSIAFGLEQQLVVHKYPGGGRVTANLGAQPSNITWSGTLWDSTAASRAAFFRRAQTLGQPVTLTWHDQAYSVVIKSFIPKVLNEYRIQYTITVSVESDLSGASAQTTGPDLDAQTRALYSATQAQVTQLQSLPGSNLPTSVTAGVNTLGGLLSNAGPLAQASAASITSIAQNINQTLATMQSYLSVANQVIDALPAGVIPSVVLQQYSAASQLVTMLTLINTNVGNGQPVKTYKTGGGVSLFHIASQYADPTFAVAIMAANGLTSSRLPQGDFALKIPPAPPIGLQ